MSREFWDERFAEPGYAYGTEPNAWLSKQRHLMEPGNKALAVADGEGRNGVWMAGQGLDVLSVDQSAVGLQKALKLARDRNVALRTQCCDLTDWTWPEATFDVVASIFVHFHPPQRPVLHKAMARALKPGGLLVLEAFRPEQLKFKTGGPPVLDMLYTADMLREDFADLEIDVLEEVVTELDEGPYHQAEAATVRLLARKP